jgi:hypothetical protein
VLIRELADYTALISQFRGAASGRQWRIRSCEPPRAKSTTPRGFLPVLIIPRQEGVTPGLEKPRDDAAISGFIGDLFEERITKENATGLFRDDTDGGELSILFYLSK